MRFLGVVFLFVGNFALAATSGYELKMELSIDGKLVSHPHIQVKAGETASTTQKNGTEQSFIDVVASEGSVQNRKGILMSFVVGVINANGERSIKATPQILAKENEPAQITVGEKNGNEISLSVVAKRKIF